MCRSSKPQLSLFLSFFFPCLLSPPPSRGQRERNKHGKQEEETKSSPLLPPRPHHAVRRNACRHQRARVGRLPPERSAAARRHQDGAARRAAAGPSFPKSGCRSLALGAARRRWLPGSFFFVKLRSGGPASGGITPSLVGTIAGRPREPVLLVSARPAPETLVLCSARS